ncbi:MAG: hypothetical protein ABL917_01175 [Parcubacteria group bacterium]
MKVGSIQQKASLPIVVFVFSCIFTIIFLLYISVKAEEKALGLTSTSKYVSF